MIAPTRTRWGWPLREAPSMDHNIKTGHDGIVGCVLRPICEGAYNF